MSLLSLPRRLLSGAVLFPLLAFAAEPIRIGEIGPLTGKEAAFGQQAHRGILMAIDEINAKGGVLGRPLAVVAEDNQSKPGDSATVAKKLVSREKVVALVCTGTSSNTLEVAPLAQNSKIPLVATTATAPEVTAGRSYVFRSCFIDPFQGNVLAKFSIDSLKKKRVAILTSVSSSYSVGLSKVFRDRLAALGGEIAVEQKYSEGDKDFRAQLTAIRAAKPDAIAVTGFYTEAALICKQARDLGLNVPIFGGDGWEAPELIEIGGKAVEGTYYASHYSSASTAPEVQEFVKKYRERFSETPDSMAPLAYDAVKIIAEAIARAGTTEGPKLRDALAATKDFPGVTGKTTIDKDRNASKPAVMLIVKDGRPQFIETIEP
ncbi:ABC transporter substrate-binding protein [Oleiharenicola lentus]|uniref:ABC transporter substrate-binding protein n=1 Tax=Oleiharenicola lentus TaxID=2508720 RepID=UPI003F678B8B